MKKIFIVLLLCISLFVNSLPVCAASIDVPVSTVYRVRFGNGYPNISYYNDPYRLYYIDCPNGWLWISFGFVNNRFDVYNIYRADSLYGSNYSTTCYLSSKDPVLYQVGSTDGSNTLVCLGVSLVDGVSGGVNAALFNAIENYYNGLNYDSNVFVGNVAPDPVFDGTGTYWKDISIVDKLFYGLFGDWWVSGQTSYNEYLNAKEIAMRTNMDSYYGDGTYDVYQQIQVMQKQSNGRWLIWALPIARYFGYDPSLYQGQGTLTVNVGEETFENTQFDVNAPVEIGVRPVVYDHETNTYISGDWRTYSSVGDTVVNRYSQTTRNDVVYTTEVQQQIQYIYVDNPTPGTTVVEQPPYSGGGTTNVYNYYTTYNNTENSYVTNNNYFSYPSNLYTDDQEAEDLLNELTPENFVKFLKKFLSTITKFFKLLISPLSFLPEWAKNFIVGVVTVVGLLAVGLVILKGIL